MARQIILTDDFGRRTTFTGESLVAESTDTASGSKPQWIEVVVYRTESGNFVVQRTTHYRIRHLREMCPRAEGYDLVDATELDTYPCPSCNKFDNPEARGYAQSSRVNVDVYNEPQDFISSFQVDGRFSNLAKTILADVSEQDRRVDDLWNTVVVP